MKELLNTQIVTIVALVLEANAALMLLEREEWRIDNVVQNASEYIYHLVAASVGSQYPSLLKNTAPKLDPTTVESITKLVVWAMQYDLIWFVVLDLFDIVEFSMCSDDILHQVVKYVEADGQFNENGDDRYHTYRLMKEYLCQKR